MGGRERREDWKVEIVAGTGRWLADLLLGGISEGIIIYSQRISISPSLYPRTLHVTMRESRGMTIIVDGSGFFFTESQTSWAVFVFKSTKLFHCYCLINIHYTT